jgi:soluble cytochrome b562
MKRLGSLLALTVLLTAACTTSPPVPESASPAAPEAKPYAPLGRMMQAIPFPASNIIFDAQSTDPGAPPAETGGAGATAQYSSVYGGWTAVENAAMAIQETANLLLIPGRTCMNGKPVPLDQEDFRKWTADLASAGEAALKAAQSKNLDAMVDVAGTLSDACAACHDKYRETADGTIEGRCTPTPAPAS